MAVAAVVAAAAVRRAAVDALLARVPVAVAAVHGAAGHTDGADRHAGGG
jgi:hypothetical protein